MKTTLKFNRSFIAKKFWLNSAEASHSPYTEGLNLVFPCPFDEFLFQKGQH